MKREKQRYPNVQSSIKSKKKSCSSEPNDGKKFLIVFRKNPLNFLNFWERNTRKVSLWGLRLWSEIFHSLQTKLSNFLNYRQLLIENVHNSSSLYILQEKYLKISRQTPANIYSSIKFKSDKIQIPELCLMNYSTSSNTQGILLLLLLFFNFGNLKLSKSYENMRDPDCVVSDYDGISREISTDEISRRNCENPQVFSRVGGCI